MRKLTEIIGLTCVRLAERYGWLFEVDQSVIDSYLDASGRAKVGREAHKELIFPNLSFVALAATACASLFVIATFPAPRLDNVLASREQQAITLYASIVQLQSRIETRPDPLGSELRELSEARSKLAEALEQLQGLQAAQKETPGVALSDNSIRIEAIRETLRLTLASDVVVETGTGSTARYPNVAHAYSDNAKYVAEVRANLNAAAAQLNLLPAPDYAYASRLGRHTITKEQVLSRSSQFPRLATKEAETRLPDHYKDWDGFLASNGHPYDAATIMRGDSLKEIPGGIVLGQTASFEDQKDLSDFVLTYELATKRLALVGPRSEIYYSEEVEPETLKALNAFVTKGQTVAVSIGWGGLDDPTRIPAKRESVVLLDPTFVDTKIGQDLVRADSLPWEFSKNPLSDWPNPMATRFRAAVAAWQERSSSEFRTYRKAYKPDRNKLRLLITKITSDPESLDDVLKSCSIDPEEFQLLSFLVETKNPDLSAPAWTVLDKVLNPESLATLYDKNVSFTLEPGRVVLHSGLQYKYVTAKVEYGDPILFGKCLKGSDVTRLNELDKIVNTHISEIVSNFQTVQSVSNYGRIAAFLRWARMPGHLQAVDFYALLSIPGHNGTQSPTPDLVN